MYGLVRRVLGRVTFRFRCSLIACFSFCIEVRLVFEWSLAGTFTNRRKLFLLAGRNCASTVCGKLTEALAIASRRILFAADVIFGLADAVSLLCVAELRWEDWRSSTFRTALRRNALWTKTLLPLAAESTRNEPASDSCGIASECMGDGIRLCCKTKTHISTVIP